MTAALAVQAGLLAAQAGSWAAAPKPLSPGPSPRGYFEGPEFDWLRERVGSFLWRPGDATRYRIKSLAPLALGASAAHPSANRATFDEWMRDENGREEARRKATIRRPLAAPPRVHGGITRSYGPVDPPPPGLSVEEYNRWRGGDPARAAAYPYILQAYPCVLYKMGQRRVVKDADAHKAALDAGFKDTPSMMNRRGFLGRLLAGLAASALAPALDLVGAPSVEAAKAAGVVVPTYHVTLQLLAREALALLTAQLSSVPYQLVADARVGDGELRHQFAIDMNPGDSITADSLDDFSEQYLRPAMAMMAAMVNRQPVTRFGTLDLPRYVEGAARVENAKLGVSIRAISDGRLSHDTGDWDQVLRFDVVCG